MENVKEFCEQDLLGTLSSFFNRCKTTKFLRDPEVSALSAARVAVGKILYYACSIVEEICICEPHISLCKIYLH